jgi:uncharacterized protein YgbK (DUF1537 family)
VAFVGRATRVEVSLPSTARPESTVAAVDLDTRSRSERAARAIARRAFASVAAKQAQILYKKIDSTLKGHIAAELAATRWSLGSRPVILAPAFPAQGRTTRDARLVLNGKPATDDLRALLAGAGLPAAHIDLPAIRGRRLARTLRRAIRTGAQGLVCDAATDADLDRIARAGLELRPRPLFVGSAGLARALARTLPRRKPAQRSAIPRREVVTVVGSASAVSATQAERLSRSRSDGRLFRLAWRREPRRKDIALVRAFGRQAARGSAVHYVLTGGETARAVLAARGINAYRLLGEVEPGVPFGLARDGTLICTKAGAFGRPDTLLRCVARLQKEMKGR